MNFILLGLILDLIGVILLGFDILRIQAGLRKAASERLNDLDVIANDYGGVAEWAKSISKSAYWTHFYSDEGRMLADKDSFDPDAAQKSFIEVTETISHLSQHVHVLSGLLLSSSVSDKKTAEISLGYTVLGLALIILGFGFQIYGNYF